VLTGPKVSKRHARLVFNYSQTTFTVVDRSTNGTLYNGAPIEGSAELKPGEKFMVGDFEIEVQPTGAGPQDRTGTNDGRALKELGPPKHDRTREASAAELLAAMAAQDAETQPVEDHFDLGFVEVDGAAADLSATTLPATPSAPKPPAGAQLPDLPKAPGAPKAPALPKTPELPKAPEIAKAPGMPKAPEPAKAAAAPAKAAGAPAKAAGAADAKAPAALAAASSPAVADDWDAPPAAPANAAAAPGGDFDDEWGEAQPLAPVLSSTSGGEFWGDNAPTPARPEIASTPVVAAGPDADEFWDEPLDAAPPAPVKPVAAQPPAKPLPEPLPAPAAPVLPPKPAPIVAAKPAAPSPEVDDAEPEPHSTKAWQALAPVKPTTPALGATERAALACLARYVEIYDQRHRVTFGKTCNCGDCLTCRARRVVTKAGR
jgi:hypothetical protein